MDFGLKESEISMINGVFRQHPDISIVKVFGSRATGNFRKNSDVDLVCWGIADEIMISRIQEQLDGLPMPYLFELKAYENIKHKELKQHIDEYAKTIYIRADE